MKALAIFFLVLGMSLCCAAQADTSPVFVRIACVPEAGLLDVEGRHLHDSVAGKLHDRDRRNKILSKAGFHDPHGLTFSCRLGATTYLVSAEQAPTSNQMCGGSPEVYLRVTRDGAPFLSDVVFGSSCKELPSITRITVGDGPRSWRGRETQVCYATGKTDQPALCDWTFGASAVFDTRFPIDQDRVRKIATRQERRE